jgi:hypothetical protein
MSAPNCKTQENLQRPCLQIRWHRSYNKKEFRSKIWVSVSGFAMTGSKLRQLLRTADRRLYSNQLGRIRSPGESVSLQSIYHRRIPIELMKKHRYKFPRPDKTSQSMKHPAGNRLFVSRRNNTWQLTLPLSNFAMLRSLPSL